eukprot:scaffold1402_cov254-Pinguiococcus_pyrenoidosus.AAC.10
MDTRNSRWNPAAIISNSAAAVSLQHHVDVSAVASQGLVHGVVHHFEDQMVQPLRRSGADVHPRPFAYGFQPFQHLDLFRIVSTSTTTAH